MLIRKIFFLILFLSWLITSFANPTNSNTLSVGSLVRVIVPHLGPEWLYGMFNRLRIEPPCYRVLIFETETNQVNYNLKLEELERLQVHSLYNGSINAPLYGNSDLWDVNDWQEVSLVKLQKSNCQSKCRVGSKGCIEK